MPTWIQFARGDTNADLTPHPAFTEIGFGWYSFPYDWSTAPVGVTNIEFVATCNGVELNDIISNTPGAPTATAVAAASNLIGYSSAQTVINRSLVQLGLATGVASALPDPFASTDGNVAQIIELLTTLGDDLNSVHDWPQLRRECDITLQAGFNTYALPSDFHKLVDQSGWNSSTRLPLMGPLSAQEAKYLKVRISGTLINVAFRLDGGVIEFNPGGTVPDQNQVMFDYISTNWVQSATSTNGPDLSAPAHATDTLLYDPELLISGVKLKWLSEHGFDTEAAQRHWDTKLEHAIGKSVGGKMLHLGGAGINPDHLLDTSNIPITGYGH